MGLCQFQVMGKEPLQINLPEMGCSVQNVVESFRSFSKASDRVQIPEEDIDAETKFLKHIVSEISVSDVVWDIGAHAGMVSAAVRLCANPEQVVAFEPNPYVFPILDSITGLISGSNQAVNVAIGETTGSRTFAADPNGGSESTFPRTDSIASEYNEFETVTVETRTVADLLEEEIPAPDVVKIDVEGAEDEVLYTLADVLDGIRYLFIEIHHLDRRFTEVDAFFDEYGLTPEVLETRRQTETCYQEFVRVDV